MLQKEARTRRNGYLAANIASYLEKEAISLQGIKDTINDNIPEEIQKDVLYGAGGMASGAGLGYLLNKGKGAAIGAAIGAPTAIGGRRALEALLTAIEERNYNKQIDKITTDADGHMSRNSTKVITPDAVPRHNTTGALSTGKWVGDKYIEGQKQVKDTI